MMEGRGSLFSLSGKKAFLTGSGGNLGPIWKETLNNAGAVVYGIDLPMGDVRDEANLLMHKNTILNTYGVPDIVINNAALDAPPQGKVTFFGNFEEIVDVNLSGAVRVANLFIEEMKEKGGILQNDHMPKVISLGILDHVEEAALSGEASYQEILIFAAHKEQEAHDYYAEMASKLGKTQAGGLFQRLAQEELGHKAKIEREYERTILKEG